MLHTLNLCVVYLKSMAFLPFISFRREPNHLSCRYSRKTQPKYIFKKTMKKAGNQFPFCKLLVALSAQSCLMLCLLLLFTFRFYFLAYSGCEVWITNGHREQMQTKQILYKAEISFTTGVPTLLNRNWHLCSHSPRTTSLSLGKAEGDQHRCSCSLAKCCKNFGKCE